MEILHALLNGREPGILMHNPQGMGALSRGLEVKTIPPREEEAAASRYLLSDGNFYVPAVAVRECTISGGTGYRIGKVGAPGVLSAAIGLLKGEFTLLGGDKQPYPGDKYSIDVRRAVVGSRGRPAGVLRARALVEVPWMLEAVFEFDSTLCSLENVKMAMERGGKAIGLLDYRPSKRGWFGKFEVTDIWTEVQ